MAGLVIPLKEECERRSQAFTRTVGDAGCLYSLDVVTEDLPVALGAALAETLATCSGQQVITIEGVATKLTLATTRHCCL
jgi:hypothetical protein